MTRAEESESSAILSEHLYADGALNHLLEIPGGGSRIPISQKVLDEGLQFVHMKGREIYKNAVRTLAQCSEEALAANNLSVEQLNWVVPHQANLRILEALAKMIHLPMEKMIVNLDRTGNTSAATIPIAFDEAIRDGRIKRDQHVLMAAFGAGLTSGSILLKY
jgi:3-oxoacyl-[acyl-carrier-protein] synthase-3